jgi:hypothetical protein
MQSVQSDEQARAIAACYQILLELAHRARETRAQRELDAGDAPSISSGNRNDPSSNAMFSPLGDLQP